MIWTLCLLQIDVTLPVSTAEKSRQVAVVFEDETSISKIVLGVERESVSVDVVDNKLFLKLLKPVDGHIDCIGGSGVLVRLRVRTGEGDASGVVKVRTRADPRPDLPEPLQFARALRTGSSLEEMTSVSLSGAIYESASVVVHARSAHRWKNLRGYILELRSVSQKTVSVDPSKFRGDGLLLIGCRDLAVSPGGSTLLFVVFEE